MTANEQWNQWKAQFRKPRFIVLAASVLGFLIILASSTYAFMPALREQLGSARQLWEVRQQKESLDKTPVPEPYDPETATPWLKKVPVKEDYAAVIQSLLQAEESSGAHIASISFKEEEPETDELTQLMQNLRKPANGQAAGGEDAEAEPEVTEQGFLVQPLVVHATGTYEQIREFWKGLQRLERLTVTKQWDMQTQADGTVDFTVTMSIFTAPDFSNVLPEPKTNVDTSPPPARDTPALSDERFLEMLRPGNN